MTVDIKKLILQLRPDLRQDFKSPKAANSSAFTAWLVTSGHREYKALADDRSFRELLDSPKNASKSSLTQLQHLIYSARPDVKEEFPLPAKQQEFLTWFYTAGLVEHDYWQWLSVGEKKLLRKLSEPWKTRLAHCLNDSSGGHRPVVSFKKRDFGVNLVGYAYGQLGIGEDVRMAGRALLAVQTPITLLDFPPGKDILQNDRSMAKYVSESGKFAFNIFCLTAEETGRYYAERGREQLVGRYNIGYWPWELGHWPKDWEMMLDLVDEVWVSSQHSFDSIRSVCNKPLYLMPMAVELGRVKNFGSLVKTRLHFKLPLTAKLFCFAFDLNSYVDRKNPKACLDAFLKAFPKTEFKSNEVGLVIKVNKPRMLNETWLELKKIARSDRRIHIIEQTLDRAELLALYQSCNCYVSLHRAEGFGMGMAEALQLGLHVICSGYSGNVDFCHAPQADLVKYRLVRVKKGQYPYARGQVWAEPNIKHAAQLMRKFYENVDARAQPQAYELFSPEVVGRRYQSRLNEIWANRNSRSGTKKLELAFNK